MAAMPSDVGVVLLRDLDGPETVLAEVLIARAEERVRARAVMSGTTFEELPGFIVDHVVASAVARVLRNPDGYRSEQDNAYGYSLDSRVASGLLSFLADEWAELGLGVRAFTLDTVPSWYPRGAV